MWYWLGRIRNPYFRNKFEAIGSGLVILVDGHGIKHTNIVEIGDGSPISIENLIVHVMAKGNNIN